MRAAILVTVLTKCPILCFFRTTIISVVLFIRTTVMATVPTKNTLFLSQSAQRTAIMSRISHINITIISVLRPNNNHKEETLDLRCKRTILLTAQTPNLRERIQNTDLMRFGLVAYVLGARKRGFLLISVNQYTFKAIGIKRVLPLCYTLLHNRTHKTF